MVKKAISILIGEQVYDLIADKLRMAEWGFASLLLLGIIWFVAPAQIPIVIYKLALVTLFAHAGYWIDRRMFPQSRCQDLILDDISSWPKSELRRAIIVAAVILAGSLAL